MDTKESETLLGSVDDGDEHHYCSKSKSKGSRFQHYIWQVGIHIVFLALNIMFFFSTFQKGSDRLRPIMNSESNSALFGCTINIGSTS